MEFNRKQLTIICLGVIVIAAMCIYPPWIHIETFYIANGADLGSSYGFIFQKPHPERGLFPKSSIDISRLSVQIFIVLVFVVGGVIILKRLDTPEKPIGPHPDVVPSLGTIEDQMRFFVPKELRRNRQARVLFGVLHRGKIDRWIYQEAFREKILELILKSGLKRSLELIEDFLHPFPEVMRGESLEETVDGLLSINQVAVEGLGRIRRSTPIRRNRMGFRKPQDTRIQKIHGSTDPLTRTRSRSENLTSGS